MGRTTYPARSLVLGAGLVLLLATGTGCSGADAADEGSGEAAAGAAPGPAPGGSPDADDLATADGAAEAGPRFVTPQIGDEVSRSVDVEIDPGAIDVSGETVASDAGGRFHVLVDQGCLDNAESFPEPGPDHVVIPSGETTTTLELEPGAHELCLQFGNLFDVAFYATHEITILVE